MGDRKKQKLCIITYPFPKIEKMYWVAKTLTERTGIKWVVDHIVPLRGKSVSGLHVENNLQVITNSRNVRKRNKFIPILGLA